MAFELPPLPYAKNALAPHMSEQTLDFHYGKHHNGYVVKLNTLVPGTKYESMSLMDVIAESSKVAADKGIFNNSAQIWNHSFYWECLSPDGGGDPSGALYDALTSSFGSVDTFREQFSQKAVTLFGSGWAWLVKKADGSLAIEQTSNADTPVTGSDTPLLTCDVWEHAYYVDYRNARPKYVEAYWNLVNWDFVAKNLG